MSFLPFQLCSATITVFKAADVHCSPEHPCIIVLSNQSKPCWRQRCMDVVVLVPAESVELPAINRADTSIGSDATDVQARDSIRCMSLTASWQRNQCGQGLLSTQQIMQQASSFPSSECVSGNTPCVAHSFIQWASLGATVSVSSHGHQDRWAIYNPSTQHESYMRGSPIQLTSYLHPGYWYCRIKHAQARMLSESARCCNAWLPYSASTSWEILVAYAEATLQQAKGNSPSQCHFGYDRSATITRSVCRASHEQLLESKALDKEGLAHIALGRQQIKQVTSSMHNCACATISMPLT